MEILDTLRFVRGAVSNKDLVPEMKHFAIENGIVRAYNGVIALGSPIDFDIDCKPAAVPLVSAIGNCNEATSLGMTEAGRLRIKSGPFKAFINCLEGETPHLMPEGEEIEINGEEVFNAVKALNPFIGNDASRPWVNGILFRGPSAFATNNVCLAEYWIGDGIPYTINVPIFAVKEMLRLGEPPTHMQICPHSVTFHYEDGRWLRTQLYETNWPDVSAILDRPAVLEPIPDELFQGLEIVKPFLQKDQLIYFRDGQIHTEPEEGLGASFTVEGLPEAGCYKLGMLQLLKGAAKLADFSTYPAPCMFQGDRLRGAIIGLRL